MRILLVIDQFYSENNGITTSAARYSKQLRELGHEVRILATSKTGMDKDIYVLPERKIFLASIFAHKQGLLFAKPVKSTLIEAISECDIVHFLMPFKLSKVGRKIAEKLHKPYTAAFHIQPENITYNVGLKHSRLLSTLIYYYFRETFYKHFTHIHCPSKFIADELRRNHYKGKLHVISNGINSTFTPPDKPKVSSADKPFIITMVARLSAEKRQDLLIKAVEKSKYRDRIQLYFAGNGPKRKHYEKLSKNLPNKPIFGFYSQAELINLLHNTDLYVHCADVEIESISCLEALACGLVPVISDSPISATKQFALCPESKFAWGNVAELASKIDYWIEHEEHRFEMSKKYSDYAQEFALDKCATDMEAMFNEAIRDHEHKAHGNIKVR